MPRASINVEVEDGDLRKFLEDVARRWTLNTIHDVLKHLHDPTLSQLFKDILRQTVSAGRAVGRRERRRQRTRPATYEEAIDESYESGRPYQYPWPPGPPPSPQPFMGVPPPGYPPPPGAYPPAGPPPPGAYPPGAHPPPPLGFVEQILNGNGAPSPHPPHRGAPTGLRQCVPVEGNPYQEEGWLCHECGFVNGAHRAECRHCRHERCDDVVAPKSDGPSGVPSGSA